MQKATSPSNNQAMHPFPHTKHSKPPILPPFPSLLPCQSPTQSRIHQSASKRRLIHWHRFHFMQRESPSEPRGAVQRSAEGAIVLRMSLPASRQSPPRPLDWTTRTGESSPTGLLVSPRREICEELDQLRREIAARRQEQELRSLELKRILPTDISEALISVPQAEDRHLPHCAHCLLL